jgi:cell division protein ZapE
LIRLQGKPVYHFPLGRAAHQALEQAFTELTDGAPGERTTILVKGRPLIVPRSARNVAWLSFAELCAKPLAAPSRSPSASQRSSSKPSRASPHSSARRRAASIS